MNSANPENNNGENYEMTSLKKELIALRQKLDFTQQNV